MEVFIFNKKDGVMNDPGLERPEILAILASECAQWGCPHCGFRSGGGSICVMSASVWGCGECGRLSILLAQGLTVSPISVSLSDTQSVFPLLTEHPRRGIACHGRADTRPAEGGEYFYVRGIGLTTGLNCFVCAESFDGQNVANIAAFVRTKESGERICDMFEVGKCLLDYREYSPDYVQIKIGACEHHEQNLRRLAELCTEAGGRIVPGFIFIAVNEVTS